MPNPGRPLSPHLGVYRWPLTMTISILHRVTGVLLSVGLLVLAAWLVTAADGSMAYGRFGDLLRSGSGRVVLALLSFAFFFHLANGVRHLVWDFGFGFEKHQANASGWGVIGATLLLTLAYWLLV
jgi:succinate dehydrogenase / fumarate reductase, cytochrome b subunit